MAIGRPEVVFDPQNPELTPGSIKWSTLCLDSVLNFEFDTGNAQGNGAKDWNLFGIWDLSFGISLWLPNLEH